MADREKVIKGLECCTGYCDDETGCPYFDIDDDCDEKLRADAIALLKAQEPVKPVPAIEDDGDWLCGKCYTSVVGTEELDEGGFVPIRFNYCQKCGQAVKWE